MSVTTTRPSERAAAGAATPADVLATATEGWSDEQRLARPAAGLVYRFDTDATGRPAAPFSPHPGSWAGGEVSSM
jgi:hypothetical protein